MTEKFQPTRRVVIQSVATGAALATLSFMSAGPAAADATSPQEANQSAPKRRLPVGLL